MREISIKYNPYKVETVILVDGKPVKKNSSLNMEDKRFQEWVEDLPKLLVDECNTKEFHVIFNGTMLDYEDLLSISKEAKKQKINIECVHIPAKEVKDKEEAIKDIFKDIQNGPFEELKQPDVKDAFRKATNSEFEVNVVATMSAGKSTLINALLCRKLMPAKQEACTATISRIKDNNDDNFRATALDKDNNRLEFHPELTYEAMTSMNSNPEVSIISIEGNIPFVSCDEISLVMVDTPGPNNSRDLNHKVVTRRMLDESSKMVVLYILNATQLAVNDDYELLKYVSESMKVGGKQSKDRYIFVVNKLDDYKKDEDSVISSIEKVRKYLEDRGIVSPNIFPAAALPALGIREYLKYGNDLDEDTIDEVVMKVKRLNRNDELHLEKYAPLTPSTRGVISSELAKAKKDENIYLEALVHTGIRSIESTINMYVEKYAKTTKIKNIVDTFDKKLESAKSFENIKREIVENEDKHKEIKSQIDLITTKLKSGEEAKKFKAKVEAINYDMEIKTATNTVIKEAEVEITKVMKEANGKMTKKDALYRCNEFETFSRNLEVDVKVKLENIVTKHVHNNAEALLNEYINKIASLVDDISIKSIELNPLDLLKGKLQDVKNIEKIIKSATNTERVKTGEREVKNSQRSGFIGFFKFWKPKYVTEDVYDNVEYVDGSLIAQKFFAPIQEALYDNSDEAVKYAKEQIRDIKKYFINQFKELDEILKGKLDELRSCTSSEENIKKIIKQSQERLFWLDDIQKRVKNILDI